MIRPLLFLLSPLLTVCVFCQGALASQGTVIVKFRSGSAALTTWLAQKRTGAIGAFTATVGSHTTRPYISDAVLTAVQARLRNDSRKNSTALYARPHGGPATQGLRDICIIYTDSIPAAVLASKLRTHPDVLYAVEAPIYEIVGQPNDPLASLQYHLALVNASAAWDELPQDAEPVIVGIVDTGIDTSHVDLQGRIARNSGEVGRDNFGRDKRYNRVDDDNNGFVDDWFGWDFTGRDGVSPDNSPIPGNSHGTHVAGIVGATINNFTGIAGVAKGVTLLPVKIGRDDPRSRTVENSGDAIVYAAAIGARVINCSFGSSSASFADLDVVTAAMELGALVVAAAGNDYSQQPFYPAAHAPCLSVAATNEGDEKATFSNFHYTVDVSAPGVRILSTIPGQDYETQDGTSMAAPVVAGITAMAILADPSLTPEQARALVMSNTKNIDSLNLSFVGTIGTGRVDALATVRQERSKLAELATIVFADDSGDGVISGGETVRITASVHNILKPLQNARITITAAPSTFSPIIDVSSTDVGTVATGDTVQAVNAFEVSIPLDAPVNGVLALQAEITDNGEYVGRQLITSTVNPSYRTINENNIRLTVTSSGNLGFHDYPSNVQGEGFSWRGGRNLLFEGALLIGTSPTYLPNVARGADPSFRDNSFTALGVVDLRRDSIPDGLRAVARFSDDNDRYPLGIVVQQSVYQSTTDSLRDAVVVAYSIHNPNSSPIRNAYAAMFFDWDLGISGADDGVAWDNERGLCVVQNTTDASIPTIGVGMASPLPLNVAAIDNRGGGNVPSIYDNFLRSEKWLTMASGKLRTNSTVTDVSMMLGGGPFDIEANGTQQIVFTIAAGSDLASMTTAANNARTYAMNLGLNAVPYTPDGESDFIVYATNGPVFAPGSSTVVNVVVHNLTPVDLYISDLFGRPVGSVTSLGNVPTGSHDVLLSIPDGATGTYFIVLRTIMGVSCLPIQIVP